MDLIKPVESLGCGQEPAPDSKGDLSLERMRTDWEAVARYTVVRKEGMGKETRREVLHQGATLKEAKALCQEAEAALALEPGYRSYVMSRPLILFELEDPELTLARYRRRRGSSGPKP